VIYVGKLYIQLAISQPLFNRLLSNLACKLLYWCSFEIGDRKLIKRKLLFSWRHTSVFYYTSSIISLDPHYPTKNKLNSDRTVWIDSYQVYWFFRSANWFLSGANSLYDLKEFVWKNISGKFQWYRIKSQKVIGDDIYRL